jgi:hypothetical protein
LATKGRINVAFNEKKILKAILDHEPEGRHALQIANDVHLDRSTVFRRCRGLENDHYILRNHKQAPYHITNKIYGDPEYLTSSFQIEAMNIVSPPYKPQLWLSMSSEFCDKKYCERIYDKKMENKDPFNRLLLYEFGNRLAAEIIYSMIQSYNKNCSTLYRKDTELSFDTKTKEIDNDRIAKMWTSSINVHRIFQNFNNLNLRFGGKKNYNNLSKVYEETYPEIYKYLETSRYDIEQKARTERKKPARKWYGNESNVDIVDEPRTAEDFLKIPVRERIRQNMGRKYPQLAAKAHEVMKMKIEKEYEEHGNRCNGRFLRRIRINAKRQEV